MTDRPPIRIVRSDVLHEGAKLRVVRDLQELPDGTLVPWESVVYVDAVLALPIDADGTVYLVEQYRPQLGRRTIEVVGGGRDPDLTPEEAMRRELQEEAGIVARLVPLGTAELGASAIRCRAHLFLAHVEHIAAPEPEPFERLIGHVVRRAALAEAVELALDGTIQDAASRVLILMVAERVRRAGAQADVGTT
ncbi:MAG: NUDIX hydrolase [Chloroflexota bacterium]|nr:NUDIX hydrolase [Chloroflexota bacterium]